MSFYCVGFLSLLLLDMLGESTESFNYDESGADWSELCTSGSKQSPINIDQDSSSIQLVDQESSNYLGLFIDYEPVSVQGEFNPHTYMEDSGTENYGTLTTEITQGSDTTYVAHQFHFHAPSEHTFNGQHTDLEMHILHKTDNGQFAVIALFFKVSNHSNADNEFIKSVIDSELKPEEFDLSDVLESGILDSFYTYTGSLTTPPCTEGVIWIVTKDIRTISSEQLDFFKNEWENNPNFANGKGNNRKTQDVNDRVVFEVDNETNSDYGGLLIMASGILLSLLI